MRTKGEQYCWTITKDERANTLEAAGTTWVNEEVVARYLSTQLGIRDYKYGQRGQEPWTRMEKEQWYALFDAISPRVQQQIARSAEVVGRGLPERPARIELVR